MITALYPRVSTQEQAMHGYSIAEQIDRMENYCRAMGWDDRQVYTDAGFSGASLDRPALRQLIRDVQAGKVGRVLVYKLDRLSRSQKDTLYLIEDVFLKSGTDFVSMTENFDTATPLGRAMIGILSVFAQLEREQIRERLSMGAIARAKAGKYGGSDRLPIGYDYKDGRLVVNEIERPQVEAVFRMYASGLSPRSIADTMNEEGRLHKGGPWKSGTIRKLVEKRTYIGEIMYGGSWYPGEHEAIISRELFEQAQAVAQRSRDQHLLRNSRPARATSYLGGLLYCGKCGARYCKCKRTTKHGPVYTYQCNSRNKKNPGAVKDPNCRNKNWSMQELDRIVLDQVRGLTLEQIVDQDPASVLQPLEKEVADIDARAARLISLYEVDGIPESLLQDRLRVLQENRAKLSGRITQIKNGPHGVDRGAVGEILGSLDKVVQNGDFDALRGILTALIDRIVVNEDDVTIFWCFSYPL